MTKLKVGYLFPSFLRFKFFPEDFDPLVKLLGRIDCIQDMFIAVDKCFRVHFRDEVEGKIHIVPGKGL